MSKPTLSGKVALVAVFFLLVSSFALFWLPSAFGQPHDALARVGFVCAVFCALGALVLSWSVSFAYLARKRNWSPQTCMKAGLPLAAVGVLMFFFAGDRRLSSVGSMLACNAILASFVTRRLVYPELTDDEAVAPKSPTLFPK
jgi:cytochrome bd-type quinol oxidase subunit 2